MSRADFKTIKNVAIDNIQLDTRNARIRAGHDQADCIQRILRKEDQVIALAQDIAENGLTTMPILVSPGSDARTYVVRDGNRRITALKLLNDPDRWSPDARLKARFKAIRDRAVASVPSVIDVLYSNNEQAVIHEILARHSGAMGGAGQLEWSAFLRTVFLVSHELPAEYKRPGQYAFWAEDHGIDVPDEFPISSLQRFFSRDNLARLGFDINPEDELVPTLRHDAVKKMAATVLGDFASSRVKVAEVFVPADAAAYISRVRQMHGLSEPTPAPTTAPTAAQAGAPGAGDGASAPPPASSAPSSRPTPTPTRAPLTPRVAPIDRKRIFGSSAPGIAIPESEPKAATIVSELRKLNLDDTPFAAAMLLRALIEISDGHYRKRKVQDQGTLAKNIKKSAEHMLSRGMLEKNEHDITVRLCGGGEQSLIQIESLQKMLHKDTHHLSKQFVNAFWDNIAPFVRACWR